MRYVNRGGVHSLRLCQDAGCCLALLGNALLFHCHPRLLDELRGLLPDDLSQWQHGTLLDTLQGKVREIEALERQLGESKRHLLSLIAEIESKPDDIDCATNARRVLAGCLPGGPQGAV